ncbi:aminotransferase class IV [Rufibacter tibetensis]|uniref:aminotransferase class IV n=1 Tax=Rufibacter tibetensis TaxID=512763 RepID=UPI0012F754B3
MILENGKLRFRSYHQERMHEAASVLRLSLPTELLSDEFEQQVLGLAEQNNCGYTARIKLKVWRSGEGLYTPQTNKADWLLTAQPTHLSSSPENIKVGICQTARTIVSPFSTFKGVNSPVYVMASIEKAERNLDDIIILDPDGNLAELTYSNLFWVKGNTLHTSNLETGCLNGVMRRALLSWATQQGWKIQEGKFKLEELDGAELVFGGNVTGLRAIKILEEQTFTTNESLLSQIKEGILV